MPGADWQRDRNVSRFGAVIGGMRGIAVQARDQCHTASRRSAPATHITLPLIPEPSRIPAMTEGFIPARPLNDAQISGRGPARTPASIPEVAMSLMPDAERLCAARIKQHGSTDKACRQCPIHAECTSGTETLTQHTLDAWRLRCNEAAIRAMPGESHVLRPATAQA